MLFDLATLEIIMLLGQVFNSFNLVRNWVQTLGHYSVLLVVLLLFRVRFRSWPIEISLFLLVIFTHPNLEFLRWLQESLISEH